MASRQSQKPLRRLVGGHVCASFLSQERRNVAESEFCMLLVAFLDLKLVPVNAPMMQGTGRSRVGEW